MIRHYPAKVMNFASSARERSLSLKGAVDAMLEGEADAIVMDVASAEDIEPWWHDDGFASSPFTKNAHHAGIVATAITLGQLQREKSNGLVAKIAQYFALASRVNEGLRYTKFVKLFVDELGARPLTLGDEYPAEFLLATRRVYQPFDAPFNFAPHCDDISYSRDRDNWPARKSYPRQLGAFLTIQGSDNNAGMVLWDTRPPSRAALDEINDEYRRTGGLAYLERTRKLSLKPQPGQLTIFHSKNLHAIEKCSSLRRTVGLFLVNEDGWRLFD
jgi:hypothetical protein